MTLPAGRFGIGLRIYLVTVAAVVATAAALLLAVGLARERRRPPPLHGLMVDVARHAARELAERWPAEPELRREVSALSEELRIRAAVYRWDGTPVARAADLAPLAPGERDALAGGEILELGPGRDRRPGEVAFAIRSGIAPVGYAVLAPPARHEPPFFPPELVALALVLVGGGLAAVVLGTSIARPLDRVARTARALGEGDFSARTGIRRSDALGTVARAFDDMADRVGALLRGQTELIANVAHELRTPLARIRVALDLAALRPAAVDPGMLEGIGADLTELEALVDDVLATARMDLAGNTASGGRPPLRRAVVEIASLVGGAVERLRQREPERAIDVTLAAALPPVEGDPVLLRRVLENLLDNARKYSPVEAGIRVLADRRGTEVAIEVVDRGEGIAPEDLARLFTPFFRADPSRARATGGVGLGLALSRRIAEAHGGALVARSAPGVGTTMTLTLPCGGRAPRGDATGPSGPLPTL